MISENGMAGEPHAQFGGGRVDSNVLGEAAQDPDLDLQLL